jgi:hypothetical protein
MITITGWWRPSEHTSGAIYPIVSSIFGQTSLVMLVVAALIFVDAQEIEVNNSAAPLCPCRPCLVRLAINPIVVAHLL